MNPNLLTLVNGAANALIAVGGIAFVVFVFGRPESVIYRSPWLARLLKGGLSLVAVGAMLNIITFSTPPVSEIILNIGLGVTFTVAAGWHFVTFVKPHPSKPDEPRTNKRSRHPSRSGGKLRSTRDRVD